jgi:hypothetical protein
MLKVYNFRIKSGIGKWYIAKISVLEKYIFDYSSKQQISEKEY